MVMPNQDPISQSATPQVSPSETGDRSSHGDGLDEATKNHLLSVVLGETLHRRQDDPADLLDRLRRWRGGLTTGEFDQSGCEAMVCQVLQFRLGGEAEKIPVQFFQEVGEILWSNPVSQRRLKRLWSALGRKR